MIDISFKQTDKPKPKQINKKQNEQTFMHAKTVEKIMYVLFIDGINMLKFGSL